MKVGNQTDDVYKSSKGKVMNEPVKMDDAVMAEIKMLQAKINESVYKMGMLQIEKMELDQRVNNFVDKEKSIKEEWTSLQKLEQSLLDKIVQKYGEGSLDLSNGVFIANESPTSTPK